MRKMSSATYTALDGDITTNITKEFTHLRYTKDIQLWTLILKQKNQ